MNTCKYNHYKVKWFIESDELNKLESSMNVEGGMSLCAQLNIFSTKVLVTNMYKPSRNINKLMKRTRMFEYVRTIRSKEHNECTFCT